MNPLELHKREHEIILKYLSDLDEMTTSVSVNVRDFSFLFNELVRFWDEHEKKEDLIFKVLAIEGYGIPIESLKFEKGKLSNYFEDISKAIRSGNDEAIKGVLFKDCGEVIDILRAHVLAEEDILSQVPFDKLSKETLGKIELLQILADEKLIED